MNTRSYIFEIAPQAKERANKGRTKLATRTWEELVSESAREQNEEMGWAPLEGANLTVSAVFEVKRRKGDLSNFLKSIEDALNGIAYEDDEQICHITSSIYDGMERNCIRVRICEL
jgi:Holliday junction resolvase RusA-like endonuclease